jgi:hypothetical protein
MSNIPDQWSSLSVLIGGFLKILFSSFFSSEEKEKEGTKRNLLGNIPVPLSSLFSFGLFVTYS